jgi:hypothetical protein
MFKNIEMLDKKNFKSLKFSIVDPKTVAKSIGMIPLGFDEIISMSCFAPVFIFGKGDKEFVSLTGISNEISIYNKKDAYLPNFVKTYPFINTYAKDENNNKVSVISIDNNPLYVNKKQKEFIFNKKGNLQKLANEKIEQVKELTRKRDISKKIIDELEKYNLLEKQSFKVKLNNEEKTIIEEFYIINRKKLVELDDKLLSLWAKKGWITLIDCHLKSLSNFEYIFNK